MPQNDQNEISIKEIIRIISNRKWWLIVTFIIVVSCVAAYLYQSIPVYQSSTTLWIEPSQSGSSFTDLFALQTGGGSTKIATEVEIIKSRRNIEKVIDELDLVNRYSQRDGYKKPLTSDQLISQISNAITVSTVKDTNIVKISVEHSDYLLARDIANTLAVVYNNLLKDLSQNDFSVRREFIESQISPASDSVLEAENNLRLFKEENDVFLLDDEARVLLENITKYEQQIDPYLIQKREAENKQKVFTESIIEEGGTVVPFDQINSQELQPKISELINTKVELVGYVASGSDLSNSSRSDELRTRIVRLENEIKVIVTNQVFPSSPLVSSYVKAFYVQLANAYTLRVLADANISYLTQLKQTYEDKMSNLPALEQKLLDLNRDVSVKENLYLLLLQNFEESRIAEAAVSGTSTIIDEAIANPVPIKPNKRMILAIGILLGLFLGVMVVFLLETFDDSVKDEESINRALGIDVSVLGRIPHLHFDENDPHDELVVYNDPTSPAAESYKLVATNVLYSNVNMPKVISVCSSEMSAGKTIISVNTAISMAQNGLRTLLIDADMRKPRVERVFGLERSTAGLVNHMLQGTELKSLILSPLEGLPILHILPVGPLPPNPTSLIASKKFNSMIEKLKQWYDRIIIDMPPLLASSDGLIISKATDGLVFVIRMGYSSNHALRLASESVSNAEIPVLGIVLNDLTKGNSYNYYHHYYYYNTDEGKSRKKKFKNKHLYRQGRDKTKKHRGKDEIMNHEKYSTAQEVEQMKVDPAELNEAEKHLHLKPDTGSGNKHTEDFLADIEKSIGNPLEGGTPDTDKQTET